MKERNYFPHDYNPTNDPKIICLLGNFGGIGYGIFWRIIELLHQEEERNYKLPLKLYIYEAIAKQMLTNAKQIEEVVKKCINEYELFESDDNFFWSKRVLHNIEKRKKISEKRSISGKAGAIAKQTQANASKLKHRKEKKIKENKINIYKLIPPKIEDVEKYCKERNNGIVAQSFIDYYQKYDWCIGKNKIKDWSACIRTWEQRNKEKEPKQNIRIL